MTSFCFFGQTRKQLEATRKKLNTKIKLVNKLIDEAKTEKKNFLEDLKDINNKIDVRTKLIATINLESQLLSKEIAANEKNIRNLNKQLADLKANYANMIYKSYKSKSQQSKAMFLLSSKSFRQAYKRLEYMKQYTSFRKKQGEEITAQTNLVKKFVDSLTLQKKFKDTLILSEKEQKNAIEKDKKNKEGLVSEIKNKEKKYKKQLQKSIKEEKLVAKKIDKLIRDAIARANRKVKVKAKKTKKGEFILSPEAKALAVKFEQNKGKLPWPLKQSIITRKFGLQKHPIYPGITINGTGLHLSTNKGAFAEAIFRGEVLNIFKDSEGIKNVLIRHGSYITSYNNLENSLVKIGDKIQTGQKLGKVYTNKVNGKTTLVFVLFKNTTRLNPASWMLKR